MCYRATERATTALEQRKKAKATRSAIFKKAELYVKEYCSEVRSIKHLVLLGWCSQVAEELGSQHLVSELALNTAPIKPR